MFDGYGRRGTGGDDGGRYTYTEKRALRCYESLITSNADNVVLNQ